MPRHLLLSFQHRAGVRPYTSCCHLAESCVFNKQSPPLILCQQYIWLNKLCGPGRRAKPPTPVLKNSIQKNIAIPSSEVTGSICRVPSTWFSQRLRLLDVFTSVGLQYGEYQCTKVEWEKFPSPFLLWFIKFFFSSFLEKISMILHNPICNT